MRKSKKQKFLQSFECDLNQLETPPHKSITNNYQIQIHTKDQIEMKMLLLNGKLSCRTQTALSESVRNMDQQFSMKKGQTRELRAQTADQQPYDFKVESQLRAVPQKKIKVKDTSISKLIALESQQSQSTLRKESSNFAAKGILKKKSIRDSSHSSHQRSISASSNKSVRFNIENFTIRQSLLFRK